MQYFYVSRAYLRNKSFELVFLPVLIVRLKKGRKIQYRPERAERPPFFNKKEWPIFNNGRLIKCAKGERGNQKSQRPKQIPIIYQKRRRRSPFQNTPKSDLEICPFSHFTHTYEHMLKLECSN